MITLQTPGQYFGVFNPVLFKFQKEAEASCKIDLYINGSFVQTFERDWLNGQATFNLSIFLKRQFDTNYPEYFSQFVRIITSHNFDNFIEVKNNFDNSLIYSGHAINAVANQDGNYDMLQDIDKFLTDFKVLKKYRSYPLTISLIPHFSNTILINNSNFIDISDYQGQPIIFDVHDDDNSIRLMEINYSDLEANNGEPITANTGEVIQVIVARDYDKITAADSCEYGAPKYVRWRNTRGGYNYWMFDHSQLIKKEISTEAPIKKTSDINNSFSSFGKILGAKATEKILLGAENLTRDEIKGLQTILLSPRIEIYERRINTAVWIPAYIDKGSSEIKTNETRFMFEVELTFAPIKLQY